MAGHFLADFYPGFIPALIPLFMQKFDLSLAMAGFLGSLGAIVASLTQPAFGWWSDRVRKPYFIIIGPLLAALFTCGAGSAPWFWLACVALLLGSAGTSMFHPQGAGLTSALSSSRRGLLMSIFIGAGTIGFSLGPVFVSYYIKWLGAETLWLFGLTGIVVGYLMLKLARDHDLSSLLMAQKKARQTHGQTRSLRNVVSYFTISCIIATGFRIFLVFIPVYLSLSGEPLTKAGLYASLLIFAGSLGSLTGGWLGDRIGRKPVAILSTVLPAVFFSLFMFFPGRASPVYWILSGYFGMLGNTTFLVGAQESLPGRESFVSSLILGVSWGVAGIAGFYAGHLGDLAQVHFHSGTRGLEFILRGFSFMFLLALPFALLLREKVHPGPHPIPVDAELR
jgi:FSR family fosmidomycin resistance protein-like MFS transporter